MQFVKSQDEGLWILVANEVAVDIAFLWLFSFVWT
jgi:hypothetical protein